MALRSLLKQRASIKRLQETDADGAPIYSWVDIADDVRCNADTSNKARGGPPFIKESQRPGARTGVVLVEYGVDLKPGDRLFIASVKGVTYGTFEVGTDVATIPDRHGDPHHIEAGITEVAQSLGRS